jgi:hypothetical protein
MICSDPALGVRLDAEHSKTSHLTRFISLSFLPLLVLSGVGHEKYMNLKTVMNTKGKGRFITFGPDCLRSEGEI